MELRQADIDFSLLCDGQAALHQAAKRNAEAYVKELVTKIDKNQINLKNINNKTALHLAIENKFPLCVVELSSHKDLDINLKNGDDISPLVLAIQKVDSAVFDTVINLKPDLELLCDKLYPVEWAAYHSQAKMLNKLYKNGAKKDRLIQNINSAAYYVLKRTLEAKPVLPGPSRPGSGNIAIGASLARTFQLLYDEKVVIPRDFKRLLDTGNAHYQNKHSSPSTPPGPVSPRKPRAGALTSGKWVYDNVRLKLEELSKL